MVVVLSDKPGESRVAATDANNSLLTHVERLDELYATGRQFEAAVVQMTLVEALLLCYLNARIHADRVTVSEDLETLRKEKRLTFGRVKSIVVDNRVLDDSSIESDLVAYVGYRNDLAHNLIGTFSSVDLERFYVMGQRLVDFFHSYLLQVARLANPSLDGTRGSR